jgi:vacuolar-type H+-ATPase subunit C/Vma6
MPLSGDFDFIQAKLHGQRSRVYERERLDELCESRTVDQLWGRLYPDAEPAGHRELERQLLADHVAALDGVRLHLPERLAPFAAWAMRRYQVENLKVLLRAWKAREPLPNVAPLLAPLRRDLALDAAAFLNAPGLPDFIRLIREEALRDAALRSVPQYEETQGTFFVESALDGTYYAGLLARHAALGAAPRRQTQALIGLEVAIYNVLAAFRLKLNYGIPYKQALPFLANGVPDARRLRRLYLSSEFREMRGAIPREMARRDGLAAASTIAELEVLFWERLLRVASRQFYRSAGDLGGVVAFFVVKRVELANLIRVIEGVRYGMEPAAIRQGLLRVRESAVLTR